MTLRSVLFAFVLLPIFAFAANTSAPLQTQVENASLYLMAGQLDKAEPLFIDIVQKAPSNSSLRLNALIQLLDIAEKKESPELASRWIVELLPYYSNNLAQRMSMETRLARHQIALDNFPVVVNRLAPFLNTPSVDRQIPLLVAHALVQLDKYEAAHPIIDLALNDHPKPPTAWLELQLIIRWHLELWQPAITTLNKLIALEPGKPERWQQLARLYSYENKADSTLASLTIARRLESDIKKLGPLITNTTGLAASTGQPAKAAADLADALNAKTLPETDENYMRLASLWLQARETDNVLSALVQADKISESGEALWLRGRLLLVEERWQEAAEDFDQAFTKGQLKTPEQTTLLAGYAWWQAGKTIKAQRAFERALTFDDTRQQAQDWLDWLKIISNKT